MCADSAPAAVHTQQMSGLAGIIGKLVRLLGATSPLQARLGLPDYGPEDRAMELLVRNLSPTQREQYARRGYFDVFGGHTGGWYRVHHARQMNVECLDKRGTTAFLLCFVPEGRLPLGDVLLAQKLALECFESDVLWTANFLPEASLRYLRSNPTLLGE